MPSNDIRRARTPLSASRPVVTPIQPSVVYASEDADALDALYEGHAKGYTYAREGHPNAEVLAELVDRLEGVLGGLVTGSGMAAVTIALLSTLRAGDHVIGADQLYGRSLRLLREELPRMGIDISLVDPTDLASLEAAVRPETRMILLETVSNPTLRVADIEGAARLCKAKGILLAVDNTFTTPRGLRPFEFGADIVIHSITKLLAGHSDATLGYVAARDPEIATRMHTLAATLGTTASPFDCWLAERGLYTFELRYDRAVSSAERLAAALAEANGVRRVLYPTRPDHPDHNRAKALLGGNGGHMVSFELDGDRDAVNRFLRATSELAFAPTLGDVGTTISHPASSSHRALSEQQRQELGIPEGFLRISVGCENTEDLIETFLSGIRSVA